MRKKLGKKILSVVFALSFVTLNLSPAVSTVSVADTTVASQAYTWKNVPIGGGGYVDNIIFSEAEKDLIYARTDMGGVYRFNPSDSSWIPLTDWVGAKDWNNLGCESMAADPEDPDRVYMATGTYTNSWTNDNGYIMRSTDRGDTWQMTELPFKCGANMLGRSMGERLVIDPNSTNVLYFGARSGNGLWKSTDYGETWNQVTGLTEVGNWSPKDYDPTMTDDYDGTLTGVVWIAPDTASSTKGTPCQTLYVGVCNKKGEDCVYVTYDGGVTFEPLAGQPRTIVPDSNDSSKTKGLLPHHGVLSSDGVLYIPYSDGAGPYDGAKGEVWKYDTKTGVWTDISPVPSSSSDCYFGYGGLAVDKNDPNVIVVSTLNSWWPDANIYRTTDGGETWTPFWEWNGYPSRTIRFTLDASYSPWLDFGNIDLEPVPAIKLGWMMGNLSLDPFNSDRMIYGTGATVWGTTNLSDIDDGGIVEFTTYTKGIEQVAVQCLMSPTTGNAHLISGMYDVNGFLHEDLDKVPDEMLIRPSLSNTCFDFAEDVPNLWVRVGSVGTGSGSRIGLSYATGTSWYAINNPWQSNDSDTTKGGIVAMSPDGKNIVWAPDGQPVYYSNATGDSWALSSGIPAGAKVVSDRVNSNYFYAFLNGTFYVSSDKGKTFTPTVTTGFPATGDIKSVSGYEGNVWIIGETKINNEVDETTSGMWYSTDFGQTFTKVNDIESGSVMGFGKAAPDSDYPAIYAHAVISGIDGYFRSDNAGESWVRINDDQHQYGVANTAIIGDPRIYGRVYLGTNGRGILYADIAGTDTPTPTVKPTVTPTVKPTVTPTVKPTVTPTVTPTVKPTVTPTITPTVTPTVAPTVTPTVKPTGTPSTTDTVPSVEVKTTNNGNTISQTYTVTSTNGTIDLSKISIEYTADGMNNAEQTVYIDNAALILNVAPYYSSINSAVTGSIVNGKLSLFVNSDTTLSAGEGNLSISIRLSKTDWSNYGTISNEVVRVYYDGVLVQQ